MAFTKITSADTTGKGISGLADTPLLSTEDMQDRFDQLAEEVIIPKHNALIDELGATTGADNIGIALPTGITGVATKLKPVIDKIVEILSGKVTGSASTETTITNSDSKVPTSGAIVKYVTAMGGGDMAKTVYDTDNSGIVDNSEKLGGQLPAYYQPVTDASLATTDKTVPGAINELDGRIDNISTTALGTSYDHTASGMTATNVQGAIDECFQNASDGKDAIGTAISGKGLTVPSEPTFAQLASLITDGLAKRTVSLSGSYDSTITYGSGNDVRLVTFSTAFSEVPTVLATSSNQQTSVTSIVPSKTGVTITVHNNNTQDGQGITVSWNASV